VGEVAPEAPTRPRLRGVSHEWAFYCSLVAAVPLVAVAEGPGAQVAVAAFAAGTVAMFGASALYNRVDWTPVARRRMRRLDHCGIYLMIAGSYTPYGLLMLDGVWRVVVLGVVWAGIAIAVAVRLAWAEAPRWLTGTIALALGWVSVVAFPVALDVLTGGGVALLFAGGALYTAGALVFALRRPDPAPAVFGYHEVLHALVVAAVACHYAMVMVFLADPR
jgi:hemolysin III